MSRQLAFSATICALVMALFVLASGSGTNTIAGDADVVAPLAMTAAIGG
ncbi:hypothetical protein [Pelagerythrobacter sp.]